MWRGCVAFSALALCAVSLVGCGRFGFEQREAWRSQAEEACLASKLVTPSAYMSRTSEIDGPGACGISYPFKVAAFAGGTVGLSNRVTLGCPIIPGIDGWLTEIVQPAAELYFGLAVTDIKAGTYSCRGRNNQAGAKTSEHAFGNAIDVMSFKLSDGRWLTVERGWKGAPEEQDFLREVFVGACRYFTTVLAPGSDIYHYNHLHLDLARHDPRGRRRICKPILKFEPRIDPERPAAVVRPAPVRPAIRPDPAEPLPPEDDEDPDSVSIVSARPAPARPLPSAAAVTPAQMSSVSTPTLYTTRTAERAASAPPSDRPRSYEVAPTLPVAPRSSPPTSASPQYGGHRSAVEERTGGPHVLQPRLGVGTAIY